MTDQQIDPSAANAECVGPQSDQAGKASSCQGCPNQSACASGAAKQKDPAIQEVNERMSEIKHKILVLSGKGGVGKSTFASQLAWALSDRGFQVGVLDIDICGPSIPRLLGVENEEVRKSNFGWTPVYANEKLSCMSVGFMLQSRNDAVIWRGPRKNGLIRQFLTEVDWESIDFLIVDAPPGTSDEHISIAQYTADANIDGAIVVTTPQELALLDVRKEISFCKKTGIRVLGVVENMSGFVCPCCEKRSEIFPALTGGAKQMCEEMNVRLLGSIPIDPLMLKCCEEGKSFLANCDDKHFGARKSFLQVIENLFQSSDKLQKTQQEHQNTQKEEVNGLINGTEIQS